MCAASEGRQQECDYETWDEGCNDQGWKEAVGVVYVCMYTAIIIMCSGSIL